MAAPTELRLDDTYVVLYVNIARLLVQGIIPFICLSFLNYRIYWVMKRRSQLGKEKGDVRIIRQVLICAIKGLLA